MYIKYLDNYNLDKGPVFYEAYYPEIQDTHRNKGYFGQNAVLETSFQVPLKHFAYSDETADQSNNESFADVDNEKTLPKEQQKAIAFRRNYINPITRQLIPFRNKNSIDSDTDKSWQATNYEGISKLVKRAIFRDLENWNALEKYLNQPELRINSREIHENLEGDSYTFPASLELEGSAKQSSSPRLPRELNIQNGDQQRPVYFVGVDANGSIMTKVDETQRTSVDTSSPSDIVSELVPSENIFQPRPQLIKYMFFKRPMFPRLDEQNEKMTETSSPQTYHSLIREKNTNDQDKQVEENVKVTSIEISKLPRHKTRHHHDKWPKRDYSNNRHRSPPTHNSTVS
ncbi:uncharacterized protein [Cardiocondyla obscurior]|uniref:uncharacterized protein isoform X2 n=1 Tax=Cardiocondyla obscurior TaxID=286306 RepID=UPI00396562FC